MDQEYPTEAKKKQLLAEREREQYLKSMKRFWQNELNKVKETDYNNLKHPLPLARIKKIMKSDEDVKMISGEAPVIFAKACEYFILDLTIRAWSHTDQGNRRTLQRSDISEAIAKSEMFDFLLDVVPIASSTEQQAPPPGAANGPPPAHYSNYPNRGGPLLEENSPYPPSAHQELPPSHYANKIPPHSYDYHPHHQSLAPPPNHHQSLAPPPNHHLPGRPPNHHPSHIPPHMGGLPPSYPPHSMRPVHPQGHPYAPSYPSGGGGYHSHPGGYEQAHMHHSHPSEQGFIDDRYNYHHS